MLKKKEKKEIKTNEVKKLSITIEVDCESTELTHAALNSAIQGIYNKVSIVDYEFNFGWNDNGSSYSVKSSVG